MESNIERRDVSPALAQEWLARNTHNRNLRSKVVRAFAADMREGNWRWNGETVKFSLDGVLLDGQHRLAAIIEADAIIPLLVVRGLPSETQETMDGGVKRKFADVLQLRGEEHYTTLAATTRRVTLWEMGYRRLSDVTVTNAQMIDTLVKHPELRAHAGEAEHVSRNCALPPSLIGWAMWLFYQLDPEDAQHFFTRLASDERHQSGEPIYELRKAAENSQSVRGSRNVTYLSAITIKAWNVFRDGRTVGILRYRPGGANPETFPEPR